MLNLDNREIKLAYHFRIPLYHTSVKRIKKGPNTSKCRPLGHVTPVWEADLATALLFLLKIPTLFLVLSSYMARCDTRPVDVQTRSAQSTRRHTLVQASQQGLC